MKAGQALVSYRALLIVGLACSVLVVTAHEGLSARIASNRKRLIEATVLSVLPGAVSSRSYVYEQPGQFRRTDVEAEVSEKSSRVELVYGGYDQHERLVGVALPAQGMGYQDVVSLLYGFRPSTEQIVGLRIVESRETPGLGDRIETDSAFVDQFRHLSVALDATGEVSHPLEVNKPGAGSHPWQVDIISGATVSSRAVVDIVRRSTVHWAPRLVRHYQELE